MRVVWVTDVHLDHAGEMQGTSFRTSLVNAKPELILVGGDTAEALTWEPYLCGIRRRTGARVAFVLGNHDYYGGSVKQEQVRARKLGEDRRGEIDWLPNVGLGFIRVSDTTGIVGEGGWGDWLHGKFGNLLLTDYRKIQELIGFPPSKKNVAERLGKVSAGRLRKNLDKAREAGLRRIIVLTHVPPFVESAWHENLPGEVQAQPFFVWGRGGKVLTNFAKTNPSISLTVLSGHTHSGGVFMPLHNLTSITAPARYQRPTIAKVMEIL